MIRRKDANEILFEIKKENYGFDEEGLFAYTKRAINVLYNDLKMKNQLKNKIACEKSVIQKMLENRKKYRIEDYIDVISVQHMRLYDYIKSEDKQCIKVRVSIYFYDNIKNNGRLELGTKERYWNDIWIVTYQNITSNNKTNFNCDNCGATMKYDAKNKMFKCEYCNNVSIYTGRDINWEIVDIEVI